MVGHFHTVLKAVLLKQLQSSLSSCKIYAVTKVQATDLKLNQNENA